ncbi:MAG: anthranilate phosphoribosyltransferase [Limnochordales bacterium]|nr:anthranilate phosphoribosyltransferase [Limnochordales bacterium]
MEAIASISRGESLSEEAAAQAMEEVMTGAATPAQIAAFITALRLKGETVDELAGAARSMRAAAHHIHPRVAPLVDTCGTGGDGARTFNISTAAALVVAGTGVAVAKHGNRAVSSAAGSADVLEALGVVVELPPSDVERCIEEVGIGFLFAPVFHPAMRFAAGPRREIGIRTIFNLLGPLTNPAQAQAQVVGVFAPCWVEPLAHVLSRLGVREALVVHGEADGIDELSLSGPSLVARLHHGRVEVGRITPEEVGLARRPLADIVGGDARENARIIRRVLGGEPGPARDVVLLNAGAALLVAGKAADLAEGIRLAAESIDSGAALARLEHLILFTRAARERHASTVRAANRTQEAAG